MLGEVRQPGAAVELVDDGGSFANQWALPWNTAWNKLVDEREPVVRLAQREAVVVTHYCIDFTCATN